MKSAIRGRLQKNNNNYFADVWAGRIVGDNSLSGWTVVESATVGIPGAEEASRVLYLI